MPPSPAIWLKAIIRDSEPPDIDESELWINPTTGEIKLRNASDVGFVVVGGANGVEVIEEQIVGVAGASSVSFLAIPATWRDLEIRYVARCDNAAAQGLLMRFNGDSGANYDYEIVQATDAAINFVGAGVGQTSMQIGRLNPSGAPAGSMSTGDIVMPFYSTATQDKGALGRIHSLDAAATGFVYLNSGGTWRTSSAPISQIDLFPGAGNFVENSRFVLRGIL